MQAAVQELERQFAKCSTNLDIIAKRLDSDFQENKRYSKNPCQILQRVKALRDDLPKVQDDWQRVIVAKQTIIGVARTQELANHRVLRQLNAATCLQDPGEEAEQPFDEFRAIHDTWEKENASRVASMQEEMYGHMLLTPEELNMEVLRTADMRTTHDAGDEEQNEKGEGAVVEGEEQHGGSQEPAQEPHHLISEAEFLSVSNIVRGRCKREECNELLELIMSKARKVKGQALPLTTTELVRIGGRVTGQTGGSRLATLRCLKRITISKEGVILNKALLKS